MAGPVRPAALLRDVERYYTGRLERFGPCALGVDWQCELTQQLRFIQLLRQVERGPAFSINDLGCGYGALAGFLRERFDAKLVKYHGIDVSAPMVEAARSANGDVRCTFTTAPALAEIADYSVASGVFNVKLAASIADWEQCVEQLLRNLHAFSRRGFAVNFLLPLDGAPRELYCTQPQRWQRFCEDELGTPAEVLADYGLEEFTLLARQQA